MTNHPQQNAPRQDRADQVRTERRRKAGATVHTGIQLGVDESKLDRRNYAYRLVNDANGRVQQLHGQDWDPAPEQALLGSTGEGSIQSKHAGSIDGKSFNAVLMRKPKTMYDEDQAAKQRPLDEMEEAIRRGTNHAANTPELAGGGTYTPGGSNTLSDAQKRA